jgi:acetamidase/formamidase
MRIHTTFSCAIGWISALTTAVAQSPKVHQLPATPATVAYGYYWAEAKPVLRINSGDVVEIETMLTSTPASLERMGIKPEDVPQNLRDIVEKVTGDARGPGGHILTGPIFVEGADSGDVLEVRFQSITLPIAYGYNGCSGFVRELCRNPGDSAAGRGSRGGRGGRGGRASSGVGASAAGGRGGRGGGGGGGGGGTSRIVMMDREKMTAEVAPGITVPLRPFFGSVGVAPAPAIGRISSNPPGRHAGNLDNKELVAGTTLYIPVFVKGALLELGDGHASQGDGEVDQTGLETNLKGRIQVLVRKDMKLEWPRAETPTHWITMGTDTSLVVATRTAIREMVKFLQETKGITQLQAYQAASMAADLRITQLVDGNVGVHMMIARSYLK